MASTAIRMTRGTSDVQVSDALGVRLDEFLARLDVGSHQLLERVVSRRDVVDLDLKEHASCGVHRRFPKLLGVHLPETLHARGLGALAERAQPLVALRLGLAPDHLHVLARALGALDQRRLRPLDVPLPYSPPEIPRESSRNP